MTSRVHPASASRRCDRRGLRLRRCGLRVLAAAAAVAALAAPAPAAAQQDAGDYRDVPAGAYYTESVASLAGDGVFEGTECDAGFCPHEPIDRATMAVWLVRILDDAEPPAASGQRFTDVPAAHPHSSHIERLAQLEVTTGCGDGTRYCPDASVTRAQMAVFLSRAFDLADGAGGTFADVAPDAWYAADVARLAASRITAGCGDGTDFCPHQHTTRAQMATFIARADGRVQLPQPPTETLAPARLLTHQQPPGATGTAHPSPDFSRVAYFTETDTTRRGDPTGTLHTASADGTNLKQISPNIYGSVRPCGDNVYARFAPVSWSPDSSHIAYTNPSSDNPLGSVLHVARADGTNPTKLTDNPPPCSDVVELVRWSPDSSRIAYDSSWNNGYGALYVAHADGTNPAKLTDNAWPLTAVWSPDSSRIAYLTSDSALYVAHADGTNPAKLTDNASGSIVWSPDSSRIAYLTSDRARYVAHADGTNPAKLTDNPAWDRPVWSPDSSRIAYTTDDGNLYVAHADGTNPAKLTDKASGSIVWSPDSSRIAYFAYLSHLTGDLALYVAHADGTNPAKLTDNPAWDPVWSPDSSRIATYGRDGALYVAHADGTNPAKLTDNPSAPILWSWVLVWSPDGSRIAYITTESADLPEPHPNPDMSSLRVLVGVIGIDGGERLDLPTRHIVPRDLSCLGQRFTLSWHLNGIGLRYQPCTS